MLTLTRLSRQPLSRAIMRNARHVLANPSMSTVADFFIGSSCEDFIFCEALKVSEAEFLDGATIAAQTVNAAMRSSVQGDDGPLNALERNGNLEPSLREALFGTIACDQHLHAARGTSPSTTMTGRVVQDQLLAELTEAETHLVRENVSLTSTRLVVGAQRSSYPRAGRQHHQLKIGSQLVICDTSDVHLWHPDRQIALMEEEGFSVQLTVAFGSNVAQGDRTTMTFEVEMDAHDVMRPATGYDPREQQNAITFSVADMNGLMPDGNAFWASASAVSLV